MHVSSTLRQLWRTARKTPITVALALISTLMVTLCDIVIPLITATAIDSATAADGGHSAGGVSITTVVVLLVVAALVRYLFQFGRRYTAAGYRTLCSTSCGWRYCAACSVSTARGRIGYGPGRWYPGRFLT